MTFAKTKFVLSLPFCAGVFFFFCHCCFLFLLFFVANNVKYSGKLHHSVSNCLEINVLTYSLPDFIVPWSYVIASLRSE